jgi:hypothetical protein
MYAITDRPEMAEEYKKRQAQLHELLMGKQDIMGNDKWEGFLAKLGLVNNHMIYTDEMGNKLRPFNDLKLEVNKIRPAYTRGREDNILEQVIVSLTQKAEVKLKGNQLFRFRGGCTLIFNLAEKFRLDHIITKNIGSQRRFLNQLNYRYGAEGANLNAFSGSIYDDDCFSDRINFAQLHFHDNL